MSKGSISKKKNPTPEKGIRNNEKEEEEVFKDVNYSKCLKTKCSVRYLCLSRMK
jgi:hypothetical protein